MIANALSTLRRVGRLGLLCSCIAAPAAVSLTSAPAQAAIPKVGKVAMVDIQRVLNETKAGKSGRKRLETSSSEKQKKLDKRRKKFEAEQSKLANLKGAEQQAAQEKLQRDYYELQSIFMALQQELAQQEAELLEKMYKNCSGIVSQIAKEKGVDLVLVKDQGTVLYNASGLDITAEVIKRYDKKYK